MNKIIQNNDIDLKITEWEESYSRNENCLFYPKEEVVKFLNRFIRKKIDKNQFQDIYDFSNPVFGLDLGCGTGRQTILMSEFGINAFGVDISKTAIEFAIRYSQKYFPCEFRPNFSISRGDKLNFDDEYFDLTICDSVLDSMHFNIAKKLIKEIDRVTKQFVFLSLIADNIFYPSGIAREEVVTNLHEQGTIQSYFNNEKINDLLQGTKFNMHWFHLISDKNRLTNEQNCRFYLVLKKECC